MKRIKFHSTPTLLMIGIGYVPGVRLAFQFPLFAITINLEYEIQEPAQ